MNKKDCLILDTRPTVIKLAPIIKKTDCFVLHTGQHAELADEMLKVFDIEPDLRLNLMKENQSIEGFFSECIVKLVGVFKAYEFRRVLVHGDTMSCLAAAQAAFICKIPLIHNEAGLRTFDKYNPFPEEMNRVIVDQLADYMFAPTKQNVKNLKRENVKGKIWRVGNTVIDALEMIKNRLPVKRPIEEKYILATVHRRESFLSNDIYEILSALKQISKEIKLVFPAHPNPNVRKVIKEVGIDFIEPLNYLDFLWHLRDCEYAISDSGGVQEEAPSFKKKLIVLRKCTERQELIDAGYGIIIKDLIKENIVKKTKEFVNKKVNIKNNPFGDGHSSERIIKILDNE